MGRGRWGADVGWHEGGTLNKRFGAFVDGAELFDAHAFGIAAPEAVAMDAQQRLLLEAAHEALAGSAPRALTGKKTLSGSVLPCRRL